MRKDSTWASIHSMRRAGQNETMLVHIRWTQPSILNLAPRRREHYRSTHPSDRSEWWLWALAVVGFVILMGGLTSMQWRG